MTAFPMIAAAPVGVLELPTLVGVSGVSTAQNPVFGPFDLGDEHPNRIIIVGTTLSDNQAHDVTSCTINGAPADEIQQVQFDAFRSVGIFSAHVPTGTTGVNISLTQPDAPDGGVRIIVLRAVSLNAAPGSSSQNTGVGTSVALPLTTRPAGFGVWFAAHRGGAPNADETTWSGAGVTELADPGLPDQNNFSAAFSAKVGTITATASWPNSDGSGIVGATWR